MQFTSDDGPVLVIIGPSGAGKSSAIHQLVREGIIEVTPTWTTRPPRSGELEEGIEHHFASEKEFSKKEAEGYFLHTVTLFGLPYRYGLPAVVKPREGTVPLIMLRAPLLSTLKNFYPNHLVYQIEDTIERVKARLLAREKAGEALGSRLNDYEKELTLGRSLATRVFVNDETKAVVERITKAIKEDFLLP